MIELFTDVLPDAALDSLKLLPFLFLTYLAMELLEHKASDKTYSIIYRSGRLGPLIGATLGAVPQCGFSAMASNLYAGRIISVGTLIAIFLSTSDEMLPVMISSGIPVLTMVYILLYKIAVGMIVGFACDLLFFRRRSGAEELSHICEREHCHCERGIFVSAVIHTVKIFLFVFIMNFLLGTAIFFIGEDRLSSVIHGAPLLSHILSSLIGLIPNCAASVIITSLYTDGLITAGTMLSGLLTGSGIGLMILFKMNRNVKENLAVCGVLLLFGVLFGILADITPVGDLITSSLGR